MDALLSNHTPVKLSDNILDLSPLPVLMIDLPKSENINETLKKIANKLSKKQILISENQEYKKAGTELWEHTNAVVPTNRVLNIKNNDVKYLKSFILEKVLEMSNIGSKTRKWNMDISDSWIQKYHNGDFLNLHNHLKDVMPDSATKFWSGAYYIDAGNPDPKKPYSGVITFHVNGHNWHIKPRPGLLLMWPSHLLHHVNPYMGDSERVMMSWNIKATPVIEI
jgi:6-phosphogluconate dehydrogenase (decarboxylating)